MGTPWLHRVRDWLEAGRETHAARRPGACAGVTGVESLEGRLLMTADPVVEAFGLQQDTGTPGDGVTSNATLVGEISMGSMAGVQFDFNGDGAFDASVMGQSDGGFTHNPAQQLGYGNANVRARAMGWDNSAGAYVYGDWTAPLSFNFQPAAIATPALGLYQDTGTPGDNITSNATVAVSAAPNQMVELDFNGDGVVDSSTYVGGSGNTTQNLSSQLAYGDAHLRGRAVQWDTIQQAYRHSDWSQPLNFTYAPEPLAVPTLSLANDTGAPGDHVTSDATIAVAASPNQMVEFDLNGDGSVDSTAYPNSSGQATQNLGYQLVYGDVHVRGRAVQWDTIQQAYRRSDWSQTLDFTYAGAPIAVPALSLVNDTGTPGDLVTADATIRATAAANQTIQFDLNGDGSADATSYTISDGTATQNLGSQVSPGEVHVRARAGQWNSAQQTYNYSDWSQPLNFTYAPTPVAVPTLALANDTGVVGDLITADPTLTGAAGVYQTVQLDLNGDGAVDLTTYANSNGNFTFNGSQIPEGGVNARVRAGQWDAAIGGNRYSEWSAPVAFVYENLQPADVPMPTLSLFNDNGAPNDNITSDGRLTGTTGANLAVSLDYNGDGTSDQWVVADASGHFTVEASPYLADGPVTARARTAQLSEATGLYVYSEETTFSFSYYDNLPPEILTFHAANYSGQIWTFWGTVRDDHAFGVTHVTFGDLLAGHSTVVQNGAFSYSLSLEVAIGFVTVQAEDEYHVGSNIMQRILF